MVSGQKFVNLVGRKLGVVIIPEWRAYRLDEERHLKWLLRYLDVDCVFDVGANVGQYAIMLRKCAEYRGRIVSFEPNPYALDTLQAAAARDPNWHVEPIALGGAPGTAEFHAYEESVFGSFHDFGVSKHAPKTMGRRTITVPVQTLESYLSAARQRWNFKRPFLKLDTQGSDVEIAKSAGTSLTEFVGLQSEIAFQTIYEGTPDYLSALGFYQSAGFFISRIVPINQANFPEVVEMDVIMIRNDFARPR